MNVLKSYFTANAKAKRFLNAMLCTSMFAPIAAYAETTVMYKGGVPLVGKNTEGGRFIARYGQFTAIGTEWDDQNGNSNQGDQLGSVTVYADGVQLPVAYYTFNNALTNLGFTSPNLGRQIAITERWIVMLAAPFNPSTSSAFIVVPRSGQYWKTCSKVNGFTNCDSDLNVVPGAPGGFNNAKISASLDRVAFYNTETKKVSIYKLPQLVNGGSLASALDTNGEITIPNQVSPLDEWNSIDLDGNRLAVAAGANLYIYQYENSNWVLKTSQPYMGGSLALYGNQLAVTNNSTDPARNTSGVPYTYFAELDSQAKILQKCQQTGTGYSMIDIDGNSAVVGLPGTKSFFAFERQNFGNREWQQRGAISITDNLNARNIALGGGKVATGLFNLWTSADGYLYNNNGGAFAADLADANCSQGSAEVKAIAAVASSTESASYSAAKAIDGIDSASSRWSSAFVDNASITFDLGKGYVLNRMSISWEAAFSRKYQVQISSDNVNWVLLHNEENGAAGIKQITFPGSSLFQSNGTTVVAGNAMGRYVRILMRQRGTSWGNSIQEVKFFSLPAAGCNLPVPTMICTGQALPPVVAPSTNYYAVQSVNSGKVLDVAGAGTANGTNVRQWDNVNSLNQRFAFIVPGEPGKMAIIPKHSGSLALEVAGNSSAEAANVQVSQFNVSTAPKFELRDHYGNGEYEIITPSGKCLTVQNAGMQNGDNVNQSTCIGVANQRWRLVP